MSGVGNYDRIAPFYDSLAKFVFGGKLNQAEAHFLNKLNSPDRVLVFGGGTGNTLDPLLCNCPEASIDYLEASSTMIALAKKRVGSRTNNIQFIHGTELKLVDTRKTYDVVITPFVLDVFEESNLKSVIDILFNALTPGGYWLQTDFYVYRDHPWWQRLLVQLMYFFFRLTAKQSNQCLPDFSFYFNRLPLEIIEQQDFSNNMVRTILYRKLRKQIPAIEKNRPGPTR